MKKHIIIGVLIFLVGFASGGVFHHLHMKKMLHKVHKSSPEERVNFIHKKLSHKLDLTEAQSNNIKPIIEKAHKKLESLKDTFHPQIEEVFKESFEAIRKLLEPKQQKKLEKIIKKIKCHAPPPFAH